MKLQSSIEKILLISAVVIVAIIIFFIVLHPAIQQEFQLNKTNYVVRTQFGNIYNGKNSLFVVVHGNTILQNSVDVKVKVSFMNNSVAFLSIPYLLTASYKMPDGDNIYLLNTTKFHLNTNNTSIINVSFISGFSNNLAIMPEYQQTESVIYYPQSALQTITLYLLNTSASPSTGGTVSPQTQYYYNGSKVVISAIPNNGFGFIDWYGFGNGNYTGNNETQLITIEGNVTEIAKFGILVPIKFEENFNVPYSVGFSSYTGNQTLMLTSGLSYKYSFESQYVNNTSKVIYILNSVTSTCGYSGNGQTINVSYADYNCKITAQYIKEYPLTLMAYNGTILTNVCGSSTICWVPAGTSVTLTGIPNTNHMFENYTGSGASSYTGTSNPVTIVMNSPVSEIAYFIKAYVVVYNPTSLNNISDIAVYTTSTSLTGDIKAHNITINSGVTLTTNGYSLIASSTFINKGTINTGFANNGGSGDEVPRGSGGSGGSYTSSYGGSGGGGGGGASFASGGNGGSTLVSGGGGGGSFSGSGGGGSTPSAPTLTNAIIQTWYNNGMLNYISGGGGGGGGGSDCAGANGGSGAYGIYIQASSITAGTINANGSNGENHTVCFENYDGGAGGGGGGGVILIAYGNGTYTAGNYNISGGNGGSGSLVGGSGGGGGNGQVLIYHYSTPPIQP